METPVSLVDLHPTLTDFSGEPRHPEDSDLPGSSLAEFLDKPDQKRTVYSEYHDWSSITGMFMLRKGFWKLVLYPGYAPQMFNLEHDPEERHEPGRRARVSGCVTGNAEGNGSHRRRRGHKPTGVRGSE